MPGRVSNKSARSSAVSRKSSVQTLNSRSASTRASTNSAEIPDEGLDSTLRKRICSIFADAQRSAATHRKSVISLRKVQEFCCYEPTKPRKHAEEDFDEDDFTREIVRCVARILVIKKSEPVGDRLVRFLGSFLKHGTEKDNEINRPVDADEAEIFPETPSSRLTSSIITLLLQLLPSKDKVVRFRCTQIISFIINTLDFIDDELFDYIRLGLLKRLRDKESSVRVQAVHGLGRLAGEGDAQAEAEDSDDDDTATGVLEKLLEVLQNDPSGDVRRTLLLNLPLTPTTLPYLLERARDVDGATRRALYARLLPALGDFRHLSLTHREKLLRWGLRDRDDAVRKATARLFRERWIEDVATSHRPAIEPIEGEAGGAVKEPPVDASPSYEGLLELLERIDIVNSGGETGIALEAMREFWDGRPDYCDAITFDDAFWNELTPESTFIARTLNGYCRSSDDSRLVALIEDKMPEVTRFGYLLQAQISALIEQVKKIATAEGEEGAEVEEDTVQLEFVVEQMLQIALTLDYSDEIGRRKMSSLMRESLAAPELPEESTKLVVEVLRCVCGGYEAGEREFCEVVLEAIAEVHDTIMGEDAAKDDGDDSFHSAVSELSDDEMPAKGKKGKKNDDDSELSEQQEVDEEKAIKEIMVNMKCLHIAQCMLQNVQCNLEQNSHLVTMLNNLVVPAVRSQEAPIRERGLLCLGLCCLLGKNLASENLTLFLHCFARGHPALQIISLQIITDILTAHPTLLSPTTAITSTTPPSSPSKSTTSPLLPPVIKAFRKALKHTDPNVQSTATLSLSKLLLSRTLLDSSLLHSLLLTYFSPHPEQRGNAATRQTLTYFLPVFTRSRPENAELVGGLVVPLLRELLNAQEEAEDDEEVLGEWVGLNGVVAQLCDWTDPRRGVGMERGDGVQGEVDGAVHLLLASNLLARIVTSACSREERKMLVGVLGKCAVLPSKTRGELVRGNLEAVREVLDSKVALDASARNALGKMESALQRLVDKMREEEQTVVVSGVEADAEVTETEERAGRRSKSARSSEEAIANFSDATPDAESTKFENLGHEDAEGAETMVVETVNMKTEKVPLRVGNERNSLADDSAVQSLLESWDSEVSED
ncbi:MAG: hypothetical protein M1820_008288 [Bogoriella megaspora]|nr:MAG: hypothetical protein M1820_008288 [Bogoriella megaspora]